MSIIESYLKHGEPGVALEHLIYMVREPHLPISAATFQRLERAAKRMRIDERKIEAIRR